MRESVFGPILLGVAALVLVAPAVHVIRRVRPVELVGLDDTAPLLPEAGAAVTGSLIASILLAMAAILLARRRFPRPPTK